MTRHALIAGASGIIGRHLAEHLHETGGWAISGLSRHGHDLPKGVRGISADLTDAASVRLTVAATWAAERLRPEFVVPFDADECWVLPRRFPRRAHSWSGSLQTCYISRSSALPAWT